MKKINTIPFWEKHTNLIHGYSTKYFGNVSFRTGDKKIIKERRKTLLKKFNVSWSDTLILPLSHSNYVLSLPKKSIILKDSDSIYNSGGHIFSNSNNVKNIYNNPEWQNGIDAVVTDIHNLFPIIMSADCAVVGCFDPVQNVIALIHAGLVGATNNIVSNTIQCMVNEYKSNLKNIEVVIYPSIRKCHYNLKKSGIWIKIKNDFIAHYGKSNFALKNNMFDLQGFIQYKLLTTGITKNNIYDVKICTVCKQNMFFSNFAADNIEQKKSEGRFASIIGIKN